MTAGDARLDVITERFDAAKHHGAPAFMIPTADVAFLLAELREAREALAGAWGEGHGAGWNDCLLDLENGGAKMSRNPYSAAVAAAKGDGE